MVVTRPEAQESRIASARPRVLTRADVPAAADVFATSFLVEPGLAALVPDPAVRSRILAYNGRLIVERVLGHATAFGIEAEGELAALAVWDPPGVRPGLPPLRTLPTLVQRTALVAAQLPGMAGPVRSHRNELIPLARARRRAVRRVSAEPSWHLAFLATHPDHQGRGYGRALVDHVLRRCDADGLPAWLETTDPVNPPIYERLGFTTVAHMDAAAWLPGLWVMRREPVPVAGAA
jgi:ribosomal protein S18 acetylase RimI-like enzyme